MSDMMRPHIHITPHDVTLANSYTLACWFCVFLANVS